MCKNEGPFKNHLYKRINELVKKDLSAKLIITTFLLI